MLIASRNFTGCVNGRKVEIEQGEAFAGDKRSADFLKAIGVLTTKRIKKEKGEAK